MTPDPTPGALDDEGRETLRYGAHPDQVAELSLPAVSHGPLPLVLLLHGGFWRARYDRRHLRPLADALAETGLAVANVEYRRVGGGGGWPTTFSDVALAVDTVPDLVEQAHPGRIAGDRVCYSGHSAGGQLAVWAALRGHLPPGAPGPLTSAPAGLVGVVALAPVIDLATAYRNGDGEGAVADLLGGGPDELPERYAAADPSAYDTPEVPVVMVHGDRDERVPIEMARRYRQRTGATLVELADNGHFELIDPTAPAFADVRAAFQRILSG